jgi:hypothetical protein
MAATTETPAFAATIMHLQPDPKYTTEKPNFLYYEAPEDTAKSNTVLDPITNIPIYDIRGRETEFTIEANGFCLMKFDPGLKHEEYYDDAKVRQIFLKNAAAAAKQKLGASRVQIFDFGVRKRQSDFPICTGEFYQYLQPSSVAHIG